MAISPAITNLLVSLGVMQIARKIDFDNVDILLLVRVGYVASQLICLGTYYYTTLVIKKKNDLTVLKYVEPKGAMSQEPAAAVVTTNRDYDLGETSKAVRGLLIGIAIMGFMHLYMKYTQPLFIQGILPLKGLYDSKILLIHILGRKTEGELKRPFVAPAGFMGAPAAEPVTEEPVAAVEAKKDK